MFDVGGVLYDWDPRFLYEKLIPDPSRLAWFLDNVVTHRWHHQHDLGRPFAKTSAELIAEHPDEEALIALYAPRWLETIPGPIPGMPGLVGELAAAGVPLFALTNFSAEFWPRFRATQPIFASFRDVVVSGVEKLAKPDPAIYHLAARRFGYPPAALLFIDDRHENVDAARAAGWRALLFRSAPELRRALDELGVFSRMAIAAPDPG